MSLQANTVHDRSRLGFINRILAGFLMIGLAACSALGPSSGEPPKVSLAGLSFAEPGLFEQGFVLQLRIQNPNDFDIPVETLAFALEVNDGPFATGLSDGGFILPASDEIVLPIQVSIATDDLIERVTAIGTGQRLDYHLFGTAEVGSWFSRSLPFERAGKFALPELPAYSGAQGTEN